MPFVMVAPKTCASFEAQRFTPHANLPPARGEGIRLEPIARLFPGLDSFFEAPVSFERFGTATARIEIGFQLLET